MHRLLPPVIYYGHGHARLIDVDQAVQQRKLQISMIAPPAGLRSPCLNCEVRRHAFCSVLSDDELVYLNRILSLVELDEGQVAFLEGDENGFLFNVISGALRLIKSLPDGRRQIVGFLFPGDIMGHAVRGHYVYSAEALKRSSLCRVPKSGLSDVMERFPKLEHKLLGMASEEIAHAQDHLLILGRKHAREKVASALTGLVERLGRKEPQGWLIELPMTRRDLADYVGLTIETVSRTITELEREGYLTRPNIHSLLLPDLETFSELTGDY